MNKLFLYNWIVVLNNELTALVLLSTVSHFMMICGYLHRMNFLVHK